MFRNKLTAIKCTPHYARPLCTVNLSAATDSFVEHLATLLKNVEVKAQTVDCLKNRRRKSIFETVAPPKEDIWLSVKKTTALFRNKLAKSPVY